MPPSINQHGRRSFSTMSLATYAPVLKKELVFLPLIGLYFLRVASVPINWAAAGKALRMLMDSARRIAGLGHSILIFPQGTRVSGQDHPLPSRDFRPLSGDRPCGGACGAQFRAVLAAFIVCQTPGDD